MIIFCFIFMCLAIVMGIRNNFVLSERLKMNVIVFSQKDWEHYCSVKNTISYDSMVWHFWVWPIRKMWPEELQKLRQNNA
jgi:hypothetical protein